MQEAPYEGETKFDEVIGKVIKWSKSYNIAFGIGLIISHREIK